MDTFDHYLTVPRLLSGQREGWNLIPFLLQLDIKSRRNIFLTDDDQAIYEVLLILEPSFEI